MTKFVSGLLTLAMVAALGAGAQAKDNDKMHGHGAMGGTMMGKHHCASGKSWVHGYTNKHGKHVKGYCR